MLTHARYVPSGSRPVRSIWSCIAWSELDVPGMSTIDVRTVGAPGGTPNGSPWPLASTLPPWTFTTWYTNLTSRSTPVGFTIVSELIFGFVSQSLWYGDGNGTTNRVRPHVPCASTARPG